ncbi:hypothetical protein SAMN04487948_105223 [Halogranum amylolyticum]|uniref:Uncharacterized protein n=1 Tax=Halogranum amylolyticum TaxID=660520 RepID=A0A1H8SMK0_9EURY|nr:hypothetical protein SAMN04487948_105223 [Halogranum amylolyticum]
MLGTVLRTTDRHPLSPVFGVVFSPSPCVFRRFKRKNGFVSLVYVADFSRLSKVEWRESR